MSAWQKCCAQRACGAKISQRIWLFITDWFTGFWGGPSTHVRPPNLSFPYLTAVGELALEADRVDVDVAWQQLCSARLSEAGTNERDLRSVLAAKHSLLTRPIKQLMASPHLLSGWLSLNQKAFRFADEHFSWAENPVEVLADTYHFLRLDWSEAGLQRT